MMEVSLLPATAGSAAILLGLIATTIVLLYLYAIRNFNYWSKKGVPFIKPRPFVGNLLDVVLFRRHFGDALYDVYQNMKDKRFVGMYFFDQPVLFLKDISLWKDIFHKDFQHFSDRGFSPNPADRLLHETLFSRKGKHWKDLRSKLTTAFTAGKLKRFFVLLEEKASYLDHYFDKAAETGSPQEVYEAFGCYTTDAVASVGFGFESSSLKNEIGIFRDVLRNVFTYPKMRTILSVATFVDVPLLRYLGSKLTSGSMYRFLRRAIWDKVGQRQKDGTVGQRGDFLDLLIELREKGSIADDDGTRAASPKDPLDMEGDILVAQAFSYLSAGHDTTTSTLSFALYELAKNMDVQEKLRTCLRSAVEKDGGVITYQGLQDIPYMDMVISEILRMYPVLPFTDRTCTKTYRLPGTDVVIDKGVFLFSSLHGIHRDPEYYPDPDRFDPERFSEANKATRPAGCYLPFGGGQRICIGMRLAYLQVKVGLAHVLLNYKFYPCEKTPAKMEFNLHSFLLHPRDGVQLNFTRV